MNEQQLLQTHRDPEDPWEVSHDAARIFNAQIASYPSHDPVSAAQHLDALTPFKRSTKPGEDAESIQSFLWEFWEVVVNLSHAYGEDTDKAQDCIIDVLTELKKIDSRNDIRPMTEESPPENLWKDLPLFGAVLGEVGGKLCY